MRYAIALKAFRQTPLPRREDRNWKKKWLWDVVYQDAVDRHYDQVLGRRDKMTRSRAKSVLNIGDEERITYVTVNRAFRRVVNPLEIQNSRARNPDGFTQADFHEAYQHLIKLAAAKHSPQPTDTEEPQKDSISEIMRRVPGQTESELSDMSATADESGS